MCQTQQVHDRGSAQNQKERETALHQWIRHCDLIVYCIVCGLLNSTTNLSIVC
jgi:hypothetical protein